MGMERQVARRETDVRDVKKTKAKRERERLEKEKNESESDPTEER